MSTRLPTRRPNQLLLVLAVLALAAEPGSAEDEPATGPWYGVRYSQTTFGIFEAFPNLAGRQAHVDGGGGDIFRDIERLNRILAYPAQINRVDILFSKEVIAK